MNSRSQRPTLTEEQLDAFIDQRLADHIEPSPEFNQRVLNRIGEEKVTTGPWTNHASWVSIVGTVAAILALVLGVQFLMPNLTDDATAEQEFTGGSPVIKEVTPSAPVSDDIQPETLYDAETLLENLGPILIDDHAMADLNMLLES